VRNKQLEKKMETTLMDLRLKDCLLGTKKGKIKLTGDKTTVILDRGRVRDIFKICILKHLLGTLSSVRPSRSVSQK
jgi:hypothetical protein